MTSAGGSSNDLGKFGCDSPLALAHKMLAYLRDHGGSSVDVILIAGDLVSHHLAVKEGQDDPDKYRMMEKTISTITDLMN